MFEIPNIQKKPIKINKLIARIRATSDAVPPR